MRAFPGQQSDDSPLLVRPYAGRRAVLESLIADLDPPWTLCPMTTDPELAREWLEEWTQVPGLEGIVVKTLTGPYRPGVRGWSKLRRRQTTEAVIGAVTGSLRRPQPVLLGRYDAAARRFRFVGRTAPLGPESARQLAEHLTAPGPGHPWTGARFNAAWGSRDPLIPILVTPELVAEVGADTAVDRGVFRHPLRFARLRLDVTPGDVPRFGEGAVPGAG
ncbi:ATP-dependent DNA ligase [Streptomyces sp. AK02-01A]|uniref:ATP-dependent DNA ligase n=1 Tax=Streptomyces sp. AK02-01A TaxID=3028648 RepID=UPI0029BA8095|nr:ATP-dependent DNA ligase [Streptomyces sp. AK02-01A]MDX3855611.1 ATP-dependent DNA ligase [Streptomyces sp. AK02-01A]